MTTLAGESRAEWVPQHAAPRIVMMAGIARARSPMLRILASSGALVEEVQDVPAILMRLHQEPRPDLVVLEWNEVGIRAIEALQSVRQSGADPLVLLMGLPQNQNTGMVAGGAASLHGATRFGMEITLRQLVQSLGLAVATRGGDGQDTDPAPRERSGEEPACGLRLDSYRAYWNGRRVDLSLTEFRVISRLAEKPGVDFSHRDIYDIMRGEGIVSGRGDEGYRGNVRAAIKRIRRKFVAVDPGFNAIRSYHGFGYHWGEEVMTESSQAADEMLPAKAGR